MNIARTTILAYHAVGICPRDRDPHNLFVSPQEFAAQMAYLARHRNVVRLEDAVQRRAHHGRASVAITFDDAYRNVLMEAAPILVENSFPATVFVPTGHIGGTSAWIEPTGCDVSIMTADELRRAETMGLEVQSHGHDHIDMRSANRDACRTDLLRSIETVERITGRKPRYLAFPFSHGSVDVQEIARELGFEAAFSIDRRHEGRYSFGRVQVGAEDTMRLFSLKTSGWYPLLRHSPAGDLSYRALRAVARRVAYGRGPSRRP